MKNYRDVLNYVPNAPANVRLGLAFCYNKLGKHDLAKKAFERVLQLVHFIQFQNLISQGQS
jgi:Tfp pilus assembly protein PilF